MVTLNPKTSRRRNWSVKGKVGYYQEKMVCHFSKLQMSAIRNEAESRGVSLISCIREALDRRYSLDGRE